MSVLIIEDELVTSRILKQIFRNHGPILVQNHDEADAVLAARSDINLIVSDNSTALGGGGEGAGLVWVLKARKKTSVPIILNTSDHMTPKDLQRLIDNNIIYQDKELGPVALKETVKALPGFEDLGAPPPSRSDIS